MQGQTKATVFGMVPARALAVLLLAVPLAGGCSLFGEEPGAGSPGAKNGAATVPPGDQRELAEYQAIVSELERASKCVTDVEIEPRFGPLRAKTPTRSPIEPRYFSDPTRASPGEAGLILDFVGAMAACRPFFGEMSTRVHRNIARLIMDTWDRQQKLYGDLRGGAITWGLFNQSSRSNADRMSGAMEALRLTDQG